MVHKIWSPLCTKFNSNNNDLVFREAFNVLTTMASVAKDFIRSRSLKYVFIYLFYHYYLIYLK